MSDTIVDIPGVGQVTFPEGMSQADIATTIKTKILPRATMEKGPVERAALAAADVANTGVNWLGTQITKGTADMLGMPDTLGGMGSRAAAWAGEKLGAPETGKALGGAFKNQMTFGGLMPTAEGINRTVFKDLGVPEVNAGDNPAFTHNVPFNLTEGKVNYGKILDAGPRALPAMALGGAAIPSMIGGASGEALGQATEGTRWELPARLFGNFLGYKAGARLQTPLPANLTPEQSRMVELAKEKGIPLSVGQETGRGRGVESAVARFPTSQGRMAAFADEQNVALNRDAVGQIGQQADRLDPTTMNRVIKTASNEFEAAKNASGNVDLTPNFFRDLNKTITKYLDNTPAAEQIPSINKRAADFVNQPGRTLTGEQYQEFRKSINDAAQDLTGTSAGKALQGMRNALDDAMESSLPADQATAWREVRKNWSNLKMLTKAAAGGTVDSRGAGNLSPSALSMALRQRQGADRFASTEGGLNDTARVAGYLADTRPNSGTPQTLMMQGALTGGPIAAGFAAGGAPGAIAAGAGLATPNIIARAMTGKGWATPAGPLIPIPASVLRNYLANQTLADQLGLLNPASAPFALAPGVMGMGRLENRQ